METVRSRDERDCAFAREALCCSPQAASHFAKVPTCNVQLPLETKNKNKRFKLLPQPTCLDAIQDEPAPKRLRSNTAQEPVRLEPADAEVQGRYERTRKNNKK